MKTSIGFDKSFQVLSILLKTMLQILTDLFWCGNYMAWNKARIDKLGGCNGADRWAIYLLLCCLDLEEIGQICFLNWLLVELMKNTLQCVWFLSFWISTVSRGKCRFVFFTYRQFGKLAMLEVDDVEEISCEL